MRAMATMIEQRPSMAEWGLQMHPRRWGARVEAWLEVERDQLFLWTPAMLGAGVAAWFVLLSPVEWLAFLGACAGVAMFAAVAATGTRLRQVLLWAATLAAVGCGLSWWRAEHVAAPVIARPIVAQLSGRVERVELLPAREIERLTQSIWVKACLIGCAFRSRS